MTFTNPQIPIWLSPGKGPNGGGNPTGNDPGGEQCCLNGECSSSNRQLSWKGFIKKFTPWDMAGEGGTREECLQRHPTCEDMTWHGSEGIAIEISVLFNGVYHGVRLQPTEIFSGDADIGEEYTINFYEGLSGDCHYNAVCVSKVRDPHVHLEVTYCKSEYCPIVNQEISFSLDIDLDVVYNRCHMYEHDAITYCGAKSWLFQKIQEYSI